MNYTGRLEGLLTLLAPLSHIGESHGPDSYLDTQHIIGPDGFPVEVFCYHGNAFRGMLRDCGSKYMLDKLCSQAKLQVPLDVFYLLFSGGSIGGDQSIDIDQARRIRQAIPLLSVLGGGVGNQILPGKINFGDSFPLCSEVQHMIPEHLRSEGHISWKQMTSERTFSRKDDAKDDNLRPYLQAEDRPLLEASGQMALPLETEDKKTKKKEAPQQMRYTIEVLSAGAKLWLRIDVRDMSAVELGALVSAFDEWSKAPYIGGQNRIGFGRVAAEFSWHDVNGPEEMDFLQIGDKGRYLGETASEAKAVYDEFLTQYTEYLAERKDGLVKLLEAD